jgi:tRNA (guanine26-N2/guanine27-N2)-dimethyltransferase
MQNHDQVEQITEGDTRVFVYKQKESVKGPGKKNHLPFYNPSMALNRDFSILVAQWLLNTHRGTVHLLDGLAASGIRGLRFGHELLGDYDVVINDWSVDAFHLIEKNLDASGCTRCTASQSNLHVLLSSKNFHYIDVDPFGSPVYFLDGAMRSILDNGVVACTATDTAALSGVFPKVCRRRYAANPCHCSCMHEIGLRILLGVICREAAKYEKGITPLACYCKDHYYRVYVHVRQGASFANQAMQQLQMIQEEQVNLKKKNHGKTMIGPLWLGKLHDASMMQQCRTIFYEKQLHTSKELLKLLENLIEEADGTPFFYTNDDMASAFKIPPPKMSTIFLTLREKGYEVHGTHCTPNGFKTNASRQVLQELFL